MHLQPEFGVLLQRVRTIVYWLTAVMNFGIHVGLFGMDGVEGFTLAPVYWNASNPMFKPSINHAVIEVQLRDEIDFVCPWDASDGSSDGSPEYYAIYQVSKTEYDSCNLFTGERNPLLIVNCSAPDAKRRFTVIFEPYQSIPNVPEYKLGMTYYYTTTSTGKKNGISNVNNGACQDFNMKLAFYVCCPTTITPGSSSTNLTSSSTKASQSSSTVRMGQFSSLSSTSNKVNKPTDTISQLLSPSSSSTTTSVVRRPRTSASTVTVRSTSSPTPNSDAPATSSFVKRTDDIATTKITQLPQPSYQQTINGCRQTFLSPMVTILALTLGRLLCHSMT